MQQGSHCYHVPLEKGLEDLRQRAIERLKGYHPGCPGFYRRRANGQPA